MAEQQYIYVAAPAVVAAPASYAGYTGYSQTPETAYVQPGYTTMVQMPETAVGATSYTLPGYQYDAQTQQFSQTAQATVIQNATQSEYATQAAYAQPGGATAYAQLATQQAACYGPQPVVYGSQGHLAAMQQAVGQTGTQQQTSAMAQAGTSNAFVQQGQQMVQQQLSMPVGYSNQQLTPGQVQQIQYAVQQTATGTAYAAQPQALQAPYAGSTLMAQQTGVAYAQPGSATNQPNSFVSQSLGAAQAQQPLTAFALQQQQTAVQQQAAAVAAAAYGQTPQQTTLYGQQNFQAAFNPNAQASMVSLATQQQQQQQQQLFIGSHGSILSSQGLAAPATFMATANAGRALSLPGQNGSLGGSFLQLGSQGQRISGVSQRGFGDRDHYDNHSHSNSNSTGNHSNSEVEIQRFPDTIFIQGLPDDTTEDMLIQHFSTVGKLKTDTRTGKPRVTLVKDKVTGRPRGEATIGYQDIESVSTAIKMFNNKEFQGRKIRIEVASRKVPAGQQPQATSSIKRSHPGDDSMDWTCPNPSCNNQNFSWRTECNRCKGPRPEQDSLLKVAAAIRRADNGALSRSNLSSNSRGTLGLGLGLRAPASLQAANVATLAAATLRARLSGLTALGSLGMGLGAIPTMPGGPMRGGLRGRVDRRGGRPY